jgi:hypothetical protein
MDSLPFAMVTANDATRAHLLSARPDAPVVPDARTHHDQPRFARTRARLASALRTGADRVAPAPSRAPRHAPRPLAH